MATLPVSSLIPWSPFDSVVWHVLEIPLTREEIQEAIDAKKLLGNPVPEHLADQSLRELHVQRIAYLVVHGWDDPIAIDVGVPCLGYHVDWVVQDGHHRLAAAIFRGDEHIQVLVDGDIDYAGSMFNVPADSLLEAHP